MFKLFHWGDVMFAGKIKLVVAIFSISINLMAAMNISPALSQISKAYRDIANETVQLLITIPSFAVVFASLSSSYIAQRITKRNTILIGSLVFTSAGVIPMFVEHFTIMMISRVLVGLGIGVMMPLVMTIIFDNFSDINERNTMIGWQGCVAAVGNITSTLLVGFLTSYSYKAAFSVHLMGLVTFFGVLFALPKTEISGFNSKTDRIKPKMKVKPSFASIRWLLVSLCFTAVVHCFATNVSMHVEGSGIGNSVVSGLALSMLTVGSFTCGLFYGKLVQVTKRYTFPIGVLLSSLGLFLMAVAHGPIIIYLSGICTGFGLGMVLPVIVTNVVCSSAPDVKTFVIGLNNAMSNLGLSIAPYVVAGVSVIFVGNSIKGRYYVCSGILMVMAAIAFILALKRKIDDKVANSSRM